MKTETNSPILFLFFSRTENREERRNREKKAQNQTPSSQTLDYEECPQAGAINLSFVLWSYENGQKTCKEGPTANQEDLIHKVAG